jgi:hypothetical protein
MNAALQYERPKLSSEDDKGICQPFKDGLPVIFSEYSATMNIRSASFSLDGITGPQPPQSGFIAEALGQRVIISRGCQTTANQAISEQVFIDVSTPTRTNPIETNEERDELEDIFNGLVEKWKKETGGYSLTVRRYAHPAYQSILTLREDVIPLILRELQQRPDWWFEALKALAKTDPTKPGDNFKDAGLAWLEWGKQRNLIS